MADLFDKNFLLAETRDAWQDAGRLYQAGVSQDEVGHLIVGLEDSDSPRELPQDELQVLYSLLQWSQSDTYSVLSHLASLEKLLLQTPGLACGYFGNSMEYTKSLGTAEPPQNPMVTGMTPIDPLTELALFSSLLQKGYWPENFKGEMGVTVYCGSRTLKLTAYRDLVNGPQLRVDGRAYAMPSASSADELKKILCRSAESDEDAFVDKAPALLEDAVQPRPAQVHSTALRPIDFFFEAHFEPLVRASLMATPALWLATVETHRGAVNAYLDAMIARMDSAEIEARVKEMSDAYYRKTHATQVRNPAHPMLGHEIPLDDQRLRYFLTDEGYATYQARYLRADETGYRLKVSMIKPERASEFFMEVGKGELALDPARLKEVLAADAVIINSNTMSWDEKMSPRELGKYRDPELRRRTNIGRNAKAIAAQMLFEKLGGRLPRELHDAAEHARFACDMPLETLQTHPSASKPFHAQAQVHVQNTQATTDTAGRQNARLSMRTKLRIFREVHEASPAGNQVSEATRLELGQAIRRSTTYVGRSRLRNAVSQYLQETHGRAPTEAEVRHLLETPAFQAELSQATGMSEILIRARLSKIRTPQPASRMTAEVGEKRKPRPLEVIRK